ncbi:m-phase phosphoprotein 6 domain-containing protein [Ditylenchus destructor]|uniref:M-phase phosphoprotein 6 domain-containing protein n=1 Tax=Ditylenchus destructor TaxID=166010 RepID=A0AAD4RDN2_9BILA|nr:m-phase phosphoprotein 6 domain-containing protein [Ditylenchus destructor]
MTSVAKISSISQVKVSPNVLKMQFMKKTVLRIEQEERARQKQIKIETPTHMWKIYPTAETVHDEPTCSLGGVTSEERITFLESLRFGRFSYLSQNPEIEKLMIYHECKRLGIEPPEEHNAEEGEIFEQEYMEQDTERADLHKASHNQLHETNTPSFHTYGRKRKHGERM